MSELYHVQNADRNVSKRDYASLGNGRLLVTKVFHTIQGEGPYAGWPAIFVRLAGCNRGDKQTGCEFCDTEFSFQRGRRMAFQEILDEAAWKAIQASQVPLMVVTGGEPMLQDNLTSFVSFARLSGWPVIQIESNGDRLADGFAEVSPDHVSLVVSPKVNKHGGYFLKPKVLARANALKLVVDVREDSPYNRLPEFLPLFAESHGPGCVYISPLTVYQRAVQPGEVASAWDQSLVDIEATKQNYAYAARIVKRYGFRTSLQTHLFLGEE